MKKILAFFGSIPKWKLSLVTGGVLVLTALIIFVAPVLRRQAVIKLGSTSGLSVTADKQDSLGIFSDSRFTLKSDEDLSVKAVRDNLTTEPEIEVEIVEVSPRQYQITPKEELKPDEIIKIKLSTGEREYSWAFQTKNNFRVVRTLPADKSTSVPTNSGIEITFSHDNYENIDRYFSISPSVEGRFERHSRITSFVPKKLEPGTLYTVTIKNGLKLDGSSDSLSEDTVFRFETASNEGYNPNRLNLGRSNYEFSTLETPAIDLYAGNIDSLNTVKVVVYQYPSINKFTEDFQNKISIPRWSVNFYDKYSIPTAGLSKVLEFSSPVQKLNYSGYFQFPQKMDKGYYLVEVGNDSLKSQALIQITDLSAYFTVSGSQTLAWVNRVNPAAPVSSAKVNVVGQDYTTNNEGIAIFTSPSSLIDDANKLVQIKDGQDTLLIPAADRKYYYPYGDYDKIRRATDKFWSYLYLDRPVYQPQDTVRFWGLVRDRDNLDKTQKLTVSLVKNDYLDFNFNQISIAEKDYQTSEVGTFIGDIVLPHLNPGWYTINVSVDGKVVMSSGLSVETYTKPAYQITVNSDKPAVIANDVINLSGKASFFEGTPVKNLNLKVFGITQDQVTTNNSGDFSLSVTTKSNPDGEYYQPQYRNFNVNPAQSEEGDINAGTTVAIFNSSVYLQAESKIVQDQATVNVKLNNIDLSKFVPYQYGDDLSFVGTPVANSQISLELIENSWQKNEVGTYYDFINKTTSPKYEYTQVRNTIGQSTLTTDNLGATSYSFQTLKDKYYEVKMTSKDSQNRVSNSTVYIYGGGLYSSSQDTRLLLSEDKSEQEGTYLIDEPVSLTPMQGATPVSTGKFLYIFSQRGIKTYSVSDPQKITFKFLESFVPNVFVQAIRFTGTTYQISDSKMLRFDTTPKKMTLDLKLDKLTYLPGEKAKLSVATSDAQGKPVSSEVNINLVDEAIFQISPVTTNPIVQIYKTIDSDIVSYYLSHQYPIESSAAEGGGCFLPGTKITMFDGSSKNIEDIKVGDTIKTRTSPGNKIPVKATVDNIFTHTVGEYIRINHFLNVTPEHNLYINGRWMTAGDVKVGDFYLNSSNHYERISEIEKFRGKYTVYNLSVAKYHTYFANGIYVHNEKGRELFADTAYFGSIKTGGDGKGNVEITLPDNLTSWRITSQALTSDLKVGVKTDKLLVKQPFFVDTIIAADYIESDKPIISLRGVGESVSANDSVSFHVSIPTLNFEKDITSSAYGTANVSLPALSSGNHKVTITGQSGQLKDILIKSFTVLPSRLSFNTNNFQLLSSLPLKGSSNFPTQLIFSDESTGKLVNTLSYLAYSSGDRLDQKLTRYVSKKLLKENFDSSLSEETFSPSAYLSTDGGYTLLPYGSSDIELSSEVACISSDSIDKPSLVNYLYKSLTEAKESLTAAQSLSGLACLHEPVLLVVNKFLTLPDLDLESRLYLSLAQAKLGDTEKSHLNALYLLEETGETTQDSAHVKIGKTKDDYIKNTSLLAVVESVNNQHDLANQLYKYVTTNSTKDVLVNGKMLIFAQDQLSKRQPLPVSFSYSLDGKKVTKELKSGETHQILVTADQLSKITFSDVVGNVGVTSIYQTPDISSTESKDLSIDREYTISGKRSVEFITSDLVKININYSIKDETQDGCYQVSDYLPSNMKPITKLFTRNILDTSITYPYAIDGQKVSFCVYKNNQKPISYYARIIAPGVYSAESSLLQSMESPSIYTLSKTTSVNVK